jgi:hypothetical protein
MDFAFTENQDIRPSSLFLMPIIASTASLIYSSTESLFLKSLLALPVSTSYLPTVWKSYTHQTSRIGGLPTSGGYAFGLLSAVSGLLCSWSIRRTKGSAKGLYAAGVALSVAGLVFRPWVSLHFHSSFLHPVVERKVARKRGEEGKEESANCEVM